MLTNLYTEEERTEFAKYLTEHLREHNDDIHNEFAAMAFADPESYQQLISTIMFGVCLATLTEDGANYEPVRELCVTKNHQNLLRAGIMSVIEDPAIIPDGADPMVVKRNAHRFLEIACSSSGERV
jgi:hypothetical protein